MKQSLVLKIFLTVFVKECLANGDVSVLTDEEYYQMPDLFALDNYDKCLSQKDAVFCVGTFELLAPQTSQIYDNIKKYSENSFANYNHTKIHRGTCLGPHTGCAIHHNTSWDQSFEACIDREMRKQYKLQARLDEFSYCKTKEQRRQFDGYDWSFLCYALTLIGLNFAGTVYDLCGRDGKEGNRFLLCFSLKANWAKFAGGSPSDKRYQRLKCFNGLRGMLTFLVHCAHVPICLMTFAANPRFIERLSTSPEINTIRNGTVAMQAFLVMSVFLRCFKTWIDAERRRPGLRTVLVAILDRFFRIAPLFMTSVGFSATLVAYTSDGPLWTKYVENEADVCRATFWRQFFLMQHWYAPACLPQAWYLSVDFQLYVICTALTVFFIRRGKSVVQPMLWIFAGSLVLLFGIVYALELKPSLQSMTPEALFSIFKTDRSFILLYQSAWGNLPGALLGALAARVYYTALQKNVDLKQYKWFTIAARSAVPATAVFLAAGNLLVTSMRSRLAVSLYATLDKPFFAAVVVFFVIGCMFEVDHVARRVVEWRGWALASRLSLASLLFHITLARVLFASKLFPATFSRMSFLFEWIALSAGTFLLALPLCLLVEYPFLALYKTYTEPRLLDGGEGAEGEVKLNGTAMTQNGIAKVKKT